MDISKIEPIILRAGDILLSYFNQGVQISFKSDGQYVTKADLECEKFLKEELGKLLPSSSFCCEESGISGNSDYIWVIDPLDGTTNFVHNISYFCISVALTYKNDPIIGIIFDPVKKELFYAQKNKGAFLNGKQIYASQIDKLEECILVTNFPYTQERRWDILNKIRNSSKSLRVMGSAALDIANVAAGRFDGCFFYDLKWWDVAAGFLIVQEAGGKVSQHNGQNITPSCDTFLAGGSAIHKFFSK